MKRRTRRVIDRKIVERLLTGGNLCTSHDFPHFSKIGDNHEWYSFLRWPPEPGVFRENHATSPQNPRYKAMTFSYPQAQTPDTPALTRRLAGGRMSSVSDGDLLAMMLGSPELAAHQSPLAASILGMLDSLKGSISAESLREIPELGEQKLCALLAGYELMRRRIQPRGVRVRSAGDVMPLVRHLATRQQEHFVAITLNGAHEVIESRVITIGLVNSTQIHPREIFADAITDRATSIIVCHNHPSGNLEPSTEDSAVTRRLAAAGETIGIRILDHIIFTMEAHYSFRDKGLLT